MVLRVLNAETGVLMNFDAAASRWFATNLTSITGAPPAVGDPCGYFGVVPWVDYRTQDGQIIELSIDGAASRWFATNPYETMLTVVCCIACTAAGRFSSWEDLT
jgi:hypothetical protein